MLLNRRREKQNTMKLYTSPSPAQDGFRAAMHDAGLDCAAPITPDGKLHRFKADGDKARNSWFVLYAGPPAAGAFGCWKRSFKENWHNGKADLSQAQRETVGRQWCEAEAARECAEAKRQAEARRVSDWILRRAKPTDPAHPYLVAKGVKPAGDLREYRRALALPLRDAAGTLHSLQFISPDSTKRFLSGGRIAACFNTLADKADGPLVICEGYATAASVFEATGFATVAAMNCGNLPAVAAALRAKWPQREIILAADSDAWTEGNPGLAKATEAAKAVGARLAVPSFPDTATKPTDFNDLARIEGRAEVRRQIEAAAAPKETDEEKLQRLAALSPIEFDRAADKEADAMGVNVGTLRSEVAKLRGKANDSAQGFAVELPDVQPWPDPVDGAEVLSAVAARFLLYVALPPGAADALALWVTHTHCYTAFIYTPRLNLCSPEKGCGKTLALDVVASLTPRALRTESITPAVLFRLVESCKPTLLLDEVDAYLNEAEELRGLLNAGHKRGARAYRCEGDSNTVRGFNAFAPAALAGIGHLPGTLHDRSIVIRLVRARPGEVLARFDSRRVETETELCRKLARWTADNFTRLETADPALPETAYNRLADNWRPLFAIAEAAGADWPARAAAAFAALTTTEDADAQGIGATLLADIAATFATAAADRFPSAKLAEALAGIEGRPWAEFGKPPKPITANSLARMLRRFSVSPHTIKLPGGDTAKGYLAEDFVDAFARFVQKPTFGNRNPVTTPANIGESAASQPSPTENRLPFEKCVSINKDGHGYGGYGCSGPPPPKEAILL
jgi:putative DNA primase/helicase